MATITGNQQANILNGTINPDIISGLGGDDRLLGGLGADFLSGGPGFDRLSGGRGNDVFFADQNDRPIDGGLGQDVAIMTTGGNNFVFGQTGFTHMEGIQDVPGAFTNVTLSAAALRTTDGNVFRFAMGDGSDSVSLINDGRLSLQSGELVYDNRVHLQFEGTERISVINQNGGSQVLTSQVTPAATLEGGFAGPGSVAAKAAAAFDLSRNFAVHTNGDLRPIAGLLDQIRQEGNGQAVTGGDIQQTAEIIQQALGRGNVNQIADILQNAGAGTGGDINQQAAIDQIANSTGGNINQTASVVQQATAFGLGAQPQGQQRAGDDDTQNAGINQQAGGNGGGGGGGGSGGNVSQSASIDQSANTSGGGNVDQQASISQNAGGEVQPANDNLFLMH